MVAKTYSTPSLQPRDRLTVEDVRHIARVMRERNIPPCANGDYRLIPAPIART